MAYNVSFLPPGGGGKTWLGSLLPSKSWRGGSNILDFLRLHLPPLPLRLSNKLLSLATSPAKGEVGSSQ